MGPGGKKPEPKAEPKQPEAKKKPKGPQPLPYEWMTDGATMTIRRDLHRRGRSDVQ